MSSHCTMSSRRHLRCAWLLLLCSSWLCSLSDGKRTPSPSSSIRLPVRAVCLGGWLVTEGWILPSLFDGIPNNDLLDGAQLQVKSVAWGAYLTAEQGGGAAVVANRTQASSRGWETFKLWRINETTFNFRASGGQFVGVGSDGCAVVAVAASPGPSETFQVVRNAGDKNRVRIRAPNGYFLQVAQGSKPVVTADHGESTSWGDDDPSVFAITKVGELQGEYQICNGYGTAKATPILRNHWGTYIVEDDFRFISASGLTAVRIPVGWWIAGDPNPPAPYVGGSLQALDNAFKWAEKYKLGVIVDLHAAPGSQNPWEHSSSRDGTQEWGATDATIAQTVQVIDFLASRLGPANATELLQFAGGHPGAVVDVHYYTVFNDLFNNLTVQQNIDFVRSNFSGELTSVTTRNGPLTFVVELDIRSFEGGSSQLPCLAPCQHAKVLKTMRNASSSDVT
ncbi:hypothetical protein GUJ93_ZPchr0005g15241 [Zizania palustris]|uniref:Mannan endo-1,4-beta-mannosidase n=1 Tax=Zizania palustris TaxID=103762 RepID=A0A8J5S2T0_ZIZPA|nr:hypothetical protein GUJ93_ZPchr0005g15241 [Zizania palustris]